MTTKLRVAQIGVGNFGAARRRFMRETGLFDLVAAYDLNPEALGQCQQEDGAQPVASYEALLDFPGVEAVMISTGAKYHTEQLIAAAECGLHVFVEKPLCSSMDEVHRLLEVQRRTGVVIGVGHTDHAHDAVCVTTKQLIESGELGTIATFEATTAHAAGLLIKPGDWRGDPENNPGGMLFQCGVHKIHELLYLFGPISHVSCLLRADVNPSTRTSDVAMCHLEFASGLIGTLNAYHVTPYRHTFHIFGTRATLYRDMRFFDEGTSLVIQRELLDGQKQPKVPVPVMCADDPYGNLRSFYRAIREGGDPSPSLRDGARAVAAIFAADESARTGQRVQVESIA